AMARLLEVERAADLGGQSFLELIAPDARAVMSEAHRAWLSGGDAGGCGPREVQLLGHRGGRPNALACGAPLGDGTLVVTFTELPADLTRLNEHLLRSARMESI